MQGTCFKFLCNITFTLFISYVQNMYIAKNALLFLQMLINLVERVHYLTTLLKLHRLCDDK